MEFDYSTSMEYGSRLLNTGNVHNALAAFLALESLMARPTSALLQSIGICWRMLGNSNKAIKAFGKAYKLADNDVDKGRIMRDWSMVPLMLGRYSGAHKCLRKSSELLRRKDIVEYFATMDFIARVYGKQGNAEAARLHHHMADVMLRQYLDDPRTRTYLLNNSVWWLKVEKGLFRRLRLTRRAFELARTAGNRKRQLQISLLFVFRPLAKLVWN